MALFGVSSLHAQWSVRESVLNKNTWYKIGVTEDGVYAIDLNGLDPERIRLFGNVTGMLPEANSKQRIDDLTEIPIQVNSASDGSIQVLFYGKSPVDMVLNDQGFYSYEPNYYTDTTFYFLCVDSDLNGQLRIQDNPQVSTTATTPVISVFPDYLYHDSEELSPFASGRKWYGDLVTGQQGGVKEFVFNVPDFDNTLMCWMESNVLGRCAKDFSYKLKVNSSIIVPQGIIHGYSNYGYGWEHHATKNFYTNDDALVVHYELNPSEENPMLFNDYFVLNFWRQLRFHGGEMAFRIVPTQVTGLIAKVQVDNAGTQTVCWDVTNPMCPARQPMEYGSNDASFGITGGEERRYQLFEPTGLKQVASFYRIPNQNLHAIKDAEMLIITPRVFWDQSEALAEFHRERDSMTCVLVDVQEIYNEFATGANDPTAVRDFIRMVYLRSNSHLKYVLLMGKGTHDYRDLKGQHNNFVPTYESATNTYDMVNSICTDDYFALMDQNEGLNCTGKVDLGVGRIPITTPEQGNAMVAKIKHYADLSATFGIWKNNHLFMADNELKTYATHADTFDQMLDTSWRVAMTKKLYVGSYPVIVTALGDDRIPEAHDKLMDYFDKGFSVFSYTGHGGVKSLTKEWVLGVSDILALDNYDRLPFVHTATCEFSKFDNPNVVSGGELMILNAHGGAIALLTTLRPTLAGNNFEMSKSLHDHLYEKEDHQVMRFGDIYRVVKSDPMYYKKDNLVYVLYGDPALRFSYPSQEIQAEAATLDKGIYTIEGSVLGQDVAVDTKFNGMVDVMVYDSKSDYTINYNVTDNGYTYDYSYFNDVLFEGRASVKGGRFLIQFPIPAKLNQGSGAGRVSFYAYDSIRNVDANGVLDTLVVEAPSVVDNQGPEIKLYWNNPDFQSGDVVVRRGVLYADLFDEHGIYHYNVSIGRDIVLRSSIPNYNNKVLNDWYESSLDDYQRGRIALPIEDLEDGTYEFSLKVWDTYDNSSEADIVINIQGGNILAQVRNYPNPFDGETWFVFNHGDMTDHLSVSIDVYDLLGRQVAAIQQETDAEIGVVPPIRWDGSALAAGLYVYRIIVTDSQGKSHSVCQRMVKR